MSNYICASPDMKRRLIRKAVDWFIGEYKTPEMVQWHPWICGTKDWLCLTEQDIAWSKSAAPEVPDGR